MARGEFIVTHKFELASLLDALENRRYADPLGLRDNMITRLRLAIAEEEQIDRERQAKGFRAAND